MAEAALAARDLQEETRRKDEAVRQSIMERLSETVSEGTIFLWRARGRSRGRASEITDIHGPQPLPAAPA